MARLVQRVWQACGVVLLGSTASCQTLIGLDELERADGGASGSAGRADEEGSHSGGKRGTAEGVTGGEGGGGNGTDGARNDGGGESPAGSGESGRGGGSGRDEEGGSAGSGGAGGMGADTGGMGAGGNPTGGTGTGGVGTGGEPSVGGSGGSATGGEAGTSATGGTTAVGTGGQCSETECGAECVDLMEDVFHCGECDRECEADGVSDWRCSEGLCTSTCLAGRGNCSQPIGPQPDDGCETNILNDVLNCGECDRACVTTGGVDEARCAAGVCTSTCLPGYVNANRPAGSTPDDGCELEDVTNCGGQGRACSGTHVSELSCEGGVCSSSCAAGWANVSRPAGSAFDDGCEVDLSTDEAHCGAVGRACETGGGVDVASCNAGICTSTCQAGYLNVTRPDGSEADDGCELDTWTDVNNCGAQDRDCANTNVTERRCEGGVCTSPCQAGYLNVTRPDESEADDGCELDTWTDANNCGAQGRGCDETHVRERRCEGGVCTSRCEVGYGNLSRPAAGSADDGCEAACPSTLGAAQMVMVPEGYCIDQTEVTQGQYAAWLNGTPAPSTQGQDAWCTWNTSYVPTGDWGDAGRANYPVVYVDWCDAYAYCKGVGKRLCGSRAGGSNDYAAYEDASQSQWYNACVSGVEDNEYPYRDTYDATLCNGADYSSTENAAVEVGTIGTCQSSVEGYAGVYDLSGNVWEWEDSCDGQGGQLDHCLLRGGSFDFFEDGLRCGNVGGYSRDSLVGIIGMVGSIGVRCCAP